VSLTQPNRTEPNCTKLSGGERVFLGPANDFARVLIKLPALQQLMSLPKGERSGGSGICKYLSRFRLVADPGITSRKIIWAKMQLWLMEVPGRFPFWGGNKLLY